MRTQAICLALAIVLMCPFALTQSGQTNGFNAWQVPHHQLMGTNAFRGTPGDVMGLPTQHGMQAEFLSRLDSLRASRTRLPLLDGEFLPKGIQRAPSPLRRIASPQSQIYVIDTAIVRCYRFADTTRHLCSFNSDARRTSDLMQTLTGGLWVDSGRETNTYDASSNMLSDLYEYRSNGQWVNRSRETSTYDPSNNKLSDLYESWWNGDWSEYYAETYTYDAGGKRLSGLFEGYVGGCWANWRVSYAYDASNNILSGLSETWSNGEWVNFQRITYTYDVKNNMLSESAENWSNGQWGIIDRDTYSYDASNNMLSQLHEQWWNGQWGFVERETCSYDASNNMLSQLYENWSNGQWDNLERYTYTYDASNNRLSGLYEYWSNDQWVNVQWQTFAYDGHRNLISFWNYSWSNGSWWPTDLPIIGLGVGPMHLVLSDSAANVYDFGNCYSVTLIPRLTVTDVASQSGNVPATYSLMQNYPNPFNPSTTIKFELPRVSHVALTVYDILGRQVSVLVNERRNAGVHEVKFDASGLATGVYLCRLTAESFVQSRTMLLLK